MVTTELSRVQQALFSPYFKHAKELCRTNPHSVGRFIVSAISHELIHRITQQSQLIATLIVLSIICCCLWVEHLFSIQNNWLKSVCNGICLPSFVCLWFMLKLSDPLFVRHVSFRKVDKNKPRCQSGQQSRARIKWIAYRKPCYKKKQTKCPRLLWFWASVKEHTY